MGVTNKQAGTRVDEIAEGIYRISTPVSKIPGGFSFNQYLVIDDQPLLFHKGPRRMQSLVQEAISSVIDVKDLQFIDFSHFESDECGSLNKFLSLAPNAVPLCGQVNSMINGDASTSRRAFSLMAKHSHSAVISFAGSTHRTFPMHGSVGT